MNARYGHLLLNSHYCYNYRNFKFNLIGSSEYMDNGKFTTRQDKSVIHLAKLARDYKKQIICPQVNNCEYTVQINIHRDMLIVRVYVHQSLNFF
jgi:hypothetical protein